MTTNQSAHAQSTTDLTLAPTRKQRQKLRALIDIGHYSVGCGYAAYLVRVQLAHERTAHARTHLQTLAAWLDQADDVLRRNRAPTPHQSDTDTNAGTTGTGSVPTTNALRSAARTLIERVLRQVATTSYLRHDPVGAALSALASAGATTDQHRLSEVLRTLSTQSSMAEKQRRENLIRVLDMYRYDANALFAIGLNLQPVIVAWLRSQPDNHALLNTLAQLDVYGGRARNGSVNSDLYVGQSNRSNVFFAGAGNDYLYSGRGADRLYGGDGNDTLDAGAGDDTLHGGLGNNVYLYGQGDGNDTILSYEDMRRDKRNVLQFKAGLDPSQVALRRDCASLVLTVQGQAEGQPEGHVVVHGFAFERDLLAARHNPLQIVRFSNGTEWDLDVLRNKARLARNSHNSSHDTNDHLIRTAQCTPNADQRMDTSAMSATASTDSGHGNDTYWLAAGDGSTRITDLDRTPGNDDALNLVDIDLHRVWLSREGDDLRLSVLGAQDDVVVAHWYRGWANQVERINTADGRTLHTGDVDNLVQAMATLGPLPAGQTRWTDRQIPNGLTVMGYAQ